MRSMTGYGQSTQRSGARSLSVEIRSVNQRFLEAKFNMPREFFPWEAELRGIVQDQVGRGKVDINISRGGNGASESSVEINLDLARSYVECWRKLQRTLKLPGAIDVSMLVGRAELVRVVERKSDAEAEIALVRDTLKRALAAFNRDREREGKALGKDVAQRAKRLQHLRGLIAKRVAGLGPVFAERIRTRVRALLEGREISEDKLLQEVALVVDRGDVTEELVRLDSHLAALAQIPKSTESTGKRFDFLLQEVHREFNTIAAKSADLEVTNHSIEARTEIEKLREQAQNVE